MDKIEVKTVRGISDAAMEGLMNDGWTVYHLQFMADGTLNVVMTRRKLEAPAVKPITVKPSAVIAPPPGAEKAPPVVTGVVAPAVAVEPPGRASAALERALMAGAEAYRARVEEGLRLLMGIRPPMVTV